MTNLRVAGARALLEEALEELSEVSVDWHPYITDYGELVLELSTDMLEQDELLVLTNRVPDIINLINEIEHILDYPA